MRPDCIDLFSVPVRLASVHHAAFHRQSWRPSWHSIPPFKLRFFLTLKDHPTEEFCSDMADVFPSAEIIGTDLSPIQPQWVPPNCKFEIDDCTSEWTFQEASFDFIHVRSLYGCIRDWPAFYDEVYKYVDPAYEARSIIPDLSQKSQTWWVV
jgi:hypothetical protein